MTNKYVHGMLPSTKTTTYTNSWYVNNFTREEGMRGELAMIAKDVRTLLPLPLLDFSILIVLNRKGICHGYRIWLEIEELSLMPHTTIGSAQLYATISRLRTRKIIEKSEIRPSIDSDDPRRQYYQITSFGIAVFNAEIERLENLIRHSRT